MALRHICSSFDMGSEDLIPLASERIAFKSPARAVFASVLTIYLSIKPF